MSTNSQFRRAILRVMHGARAAALVAAAFSVVGCLQLQSNEPPDRSTCTSCHGNERRSGDSLKRSAPPRDLDGNTATSAKGVGAHERHLSSKGHAPVDCAQCHIVPETVFSRGHVDSEAPAEVTFGNLATISNRHPEYNRKTGNCSDTYCHRDATVKWTDEKSEKDACGTCHGAPPALPHPQKDDCSGCHGDVIGKGGKWVRPELHVNGKVEVKVQAECAGCHGSNSETGAPPPDLLGNMAPSARGVGAHATHLNDSVTHRAIACNECHQVPEKIESDGHIDDDGHAEITFGALARTQGRAPAYDGDLGSCSNSYCHGTASGTWTAPRDSDKACGSCHALPPPAPHSPLTECSRCHTKVAAPGQKIKDPSLHVNGSVEVELNCASCHGATEDGAPPIDLKGNTQTSARGVGAHALHLQASATHLAIACSECHRVPTKIEEPQHIDGDGMAEITFGVLASADGSKPAYDRNSVACAGTYCHRDAKPIWQAPRNSNDACGSCHALPPPAPHTTSTQCSNCHGRVVTADRQIKDPSLHVNGKVEVTYGTCNSCHGTSSDGAPPPDLKGNTQPSARGVGAHALHLTPGATHAAVACGECHRVPINVEDPTHLDGDGTAEVIFGTLASTASYQPQYDRATAACSGSYCHRDAKPEWQAPRTSEAACGSCHGLPPPSPHPQRSDCSQCHAAVIKADRTFIAPALHVDGKVETSPMQCNSCHGTDTTGAPPLDLSGNTNSSARGVGAHTEHLLAGPTHAAIACNECHRVPATLDEPQHMDGDRTAEVTFGRLASANGSRPAYDSAKAACSGSYCHKTAQPNWQAPRSSNDACGSCHGLPPPAPHPQKSDCSACHGDVINNARSMIAPALHVNGKVELGTMQCSSCHGSASTPAPPTDTSGNSATSARGVGAHAIHLQGSSTHLAVACNECHVVPATWDAPGHVDSSGPAEVTFGAFAKLNGSRPVYSAAATTCAGSYCHGQATPVWTAPRNSTQACGTCHGLPPAAPHPQNNQCARCHGAVVDANQAIISPSLHIDGQIQVTQTCNLCHGSAQNAAPPMDLSGSSDVGRIGVGAHQLHLSGGNFSRPVPCGECHIVPATITAVGHIDSGPLTPADVTFAGAAAAYGQNPQFSRATLTCNGSWCHGPQDPQNLSPSWLAAPGSLTCNSCHGFPPPAPHAQSTQCSKCHSDVDAQGRIIDPSAHVNGDIDL